jgi:hypothetical protein
LIDNILSIFFVQYLSQFLKPILNTLPEGAEAISPGQRPGLLRMIAYRPVRAKALKLLTIYKAFALTGRLADCHYTQGAALG